MKILKIVCKVVFVTTVVGVLCSCAVAGWHKQGVSDVETENALAQCQYEQGLNHVNQGDFVTNCMKRQGFRYGY